MVAKSRALPWKTRRARGSAAVARRCTMISRMFCLEYGGKFILLPSSRLRATPPFQLSGGTTAAVDVNLEIAVRHPGPGTLYVGATCHPKQSGRRCSQVAKVTII